jgi:hypothetical protein
MSAWQRRAADSGLPEEFAKKHEAQRVEGIRCALFSCAQSDAMFVCRMMWFLVYNEVDGDASSCRRESGGAAGGGGGTVDGNDSVG